MSNVNLVNHIGAVVSFPVSVRSESDSEYRCLFQTSRYYQSLAEVKAIVKHDNFNVKDSQTVMQIVQIARKILLHIDSKEFNRIDRDEAKKISKSIKSQIDRLSNEMFEKDSERARERLFSALNSIKTFSDNCFEKSFI